MPFEGITIFSDETQDSTKLTKQTDDPAKTTPVFADAYIFETMRMEVRNERSKLMEQLTTKVGSSEFTAVEKNEALDDMAKLTKLNSAEALMELEIIALGYPEAFVRSDEGVVKVTVLSTEGKSAQMADEIMRYVMTSWDNARKVEVSFTGDSE